MITLGQLRTELATAGDPQKAEQQQRYMKSAMPYHGVAAPELRALLRPHLRAFAPADRADWERTVRTFWDGRRTARSGTPRSRSPGIDPPATGRTPPPSTSIGTWS